MKDQYCRTIDYLRISLTDRCNLRCVYCMPEGGVESVAHAEILSYEEIVRLCRLAARQGVSKVKLTGGEPLVRKGCAQLVAALKAVPGIDKVTLTTNGILLTEQMAALAAAGLDAINISLDTLDREKYRELTRRDELERALAGIEEALRYPQISVKINCVPLCDEPQNLVAVAGLAKERPLHVRFIEMMPVGYGRLCRSADEAQVREILEAAYGRLTPCREHLGNGPASYYSLPGFAGRIGFISAMSHRFCDRCNRLRLTADGMLIGCLQRQQGLDLKALLRGGASDEEIEAGIRQVAADKPKQHTFEEPYADEGRTDETGKRNMFQIGG